jgi:hypothetical protein
MADDKNITMPLGFLAGQNISPRLALENLASEILGHAADLEEQSSRADKTEHFDQAKTLHDQARLLRRYGWALWLINAQAGGGVVTGDPRALADLAKTYNLVIPGAWLAPKDDPAKE